MTRMQSFSKAENELLPKFRKMTNEAESTEDVKKFFVYCMQELFTHVSDGRLEPRFEDVGLLPEGEKLFFISESLRSREAFAEVWQESDLPQIVSRFAHLAVARYKHLETNPRKSEAKIRK